MQKVTYLICCRKLRLRQMKKAENNFGYQFKFTCPLQMTGTRLRNTATQKRNEIWSLKKSEIAKLFLKIWICYIRRESIPRKDKKWQGFYTTICCNFSLDKRTFQRFMQIYSDKLPHFVDKIFLPKKNRLFMDKKIAEMRTLLDVIVNNSKNFKK